MMCFLEFAVTLCFAPNPILETCLASFTSRECVTVRFRSCFLLFSFDLEHRFRPSASSYSDKCVPLALWPNSRNCIRGRHQAHSDNFCLFFPSGVRVCSAYVGLLRRVSNPPAVVLQRNASRLRTGRSLRPGHLRRLQLPISLDLSVSFLRQIHTQSFIPTHRHNSFTYTNRIRPEG